MSTIFKSKKPLVFISHVHEDADFASAIKTWLEQSFLGGVELFVSSSPDSLPPGSDWPRRIKSALADASIMLLLLSPRSITRRWIYFEAGAAYVKNVPVVPLCIAGLSLSDLEPPLSFLQGLSISDMASRATLLELVAKYAGLHTPKTAELLVLPDRVDRLESDTTDRQTYSITNYKLTTMQARKILQRVPKDQRKLLNELMTVIELQSFPGNDPDDVLAMTKRAFSESVLLPKETAEEMLIKLEGVRKSKEWGEKNPYGKLNDVLKLIREVIPTKQEAANMLLDQSDEVLVPFLLVQYRLKRWTRQTGNWISEVLVSGDYGKSVITILEDRILHEPLNSRSFKNAVLAARRALGDEFNEWYESIRGLSYSDEVQRHEKEVAIRREKEQELRMMYEKHRLERLLKANRQAEGEESEES
jgi:hypothetical protein